ncbi:unnamed protein product, partial [Ascophyllum nodosum]
FYYVWAEPRPVVLLSKIMGGVVMPCCDTMINLRRSTSNFLANSGFWCFSECLLMLTRLTCENRGKLHLSCFQLARAPEGRC